MSEHLVPCDTCHRHVRASERGCPFCAKPGALRVTSPAAAALLAGAALAGAVSLPSEASGQDLSGTSLIGARTQMEHAGAQGYGGPPSEYAMYRLPPRTEPVPAPPPVEVRSVQANNRFVAARARAAVNARRVQLIGCLAPASSAATSRVSFRVEFDLTPTGALDPLQVRGSLRVDELRCVTRELSRLRVSGVEGIAEPVHVAMVVQVTVPVRPPPRVQPRPRPPEVRPAPAPSPNLCANFTPPGCRRTGCGDGMVCDTRVRCVPSSCGCDPATGRTVCTADCGGGVCVPARGAPLF